MTSFTPRPFGKYFLTDRIAVGGMAEIYKAKTFGVDGFEKQLVIKKILAHYAEDHDFIKMLIDEAKLSVQLSHTNIVQVYDLGKVGDDYFISMEFIDGQNLRQLLNRLRERGDSLSEDLAIYIASEIAKGLDYAHHKKDERNIPLDIVHRDISPQNILISYEGEVKIVDFGIAKAAMNISQTLAGTLKGKVAYMSPEQALGKPIDAKTDIFSSGSILYEMLMGEKLFSGDNQLEVLKKIHSAAIAEEALPHAIRPAVKTILSKALAQKPKDRFDTAGDFQLALTQHLYGSYRNFSPRNLSFLMKSAFADVLEARKAKSLQEAIALDAKTKTLLIEGEEAESIVHRESEPLASQAATPPSASGHSDELTLSHPGIPVPPELLKEAAQAEPAAISTPLSPPTRPDVPNDVPPDTPIIEDRQVPQTPTLQDSAPPSKAEKAPSPSRRRYFLISTLALVTLAIIGGIAFWPSHRGDAPPPSPPPPPIPAPVLFAKLDIRTTPPNAVISVDTRRETATSPALLSHFSVGEAVRVRIEKPGFETVERVFSPTSAETAQWNIALTPLYARLTLTSEPTGARVFLDGADTGQTTPAALDKLALETAHTLRLEKEGYEPLLQHFLAGEATEYAFSLNLSAKAPPAEEKKPEPPKITPETKKEKPQAPPETTKKPKESKKAKAAAALLKPPATLSVDSSPSGASVRVNGEIVGTTPGTFPIHTESADVAVEKEGLYPYKTSLQFKAGEEQKLRKVKLAPLTGKIFVNSNPQGATVYFNGEKAGRTPLLIQGVSKDTPYAVRIEYKRYKTWQKTVTLTENSLEIVAIMDRESE